MARLSEAALEVLSGIVGPVPAHLCLTAVGAEVNKDPEDLSAEDFDVFAERIRSDLCRFASQELIEQALGEIRSKL